MDSSITRRGQPCWYRIPKVGFLAINDSFMLEGAIYHLIRVRIASLFLFIPFRFLRAIRSFFGFS